MSLNLHALNLYFIRAGQDRILTVYSWYFWQGNHEFVYSHMWCTHGSGLPYALSTHNVDTVIWIACLLPNTT